MITRQKQLFYFVNGVPYASLEEAQKVDLLNLMPAESEKALSNAEIADWLIKNSDAIVDTLTTTPRIRARKPRSDRGVPRKKKLAQAMAHKPQPAA